MPKFTLHRVNIGPRLTLCFVFIILAMLVGNAVLLWQFHLVRAQAARLSAVDQKVVVVLQVHTRLMSFYVRLDELADAEAAAQLLREAESLRNALLEDNRRSRDALSRLPPEAQPDQTILPTLEAIRAVLPEQIEAITALAKAGDWEAVRSRLANKVRPLESMTSALVRNVDRQVAEERAQAVMNIGQAQRRILLIVPLTAALTLLFASLLGLAVTRSITQPLGRLMEGSAALARGDFSHRVPASGRDEIARLGIVFNDMIVRLQGFYRELQRRETYLAEAQKLSRTGSFGWDVSSGEIYWSEETFRIFECEPKNTVTLELIVQRTHPEDRLVVQQLIERVSSERTEFDFEHRLLMSDGSVKYLRVAGRPSTDEWGRFEFVGAVTDITERKRAEEALQTAFEEIKALKDKLHEENIALREEIDRSSMFEEIVGESPALQGVLARVAKVAPTDSTVLITGETGTGKELIARAIHKRSRRAARAFVSVNCATIPPSLVASALFGHEKGAFTGAMQRRLGRFELAEEGTIFLDEVGELPLETQISLLRVLQEREFQRVGGTKALRANVRVIAATNRDLQAGIEAGSFRSDLYYRLNVFPIEMPPLRQRREDIPLLVEYFIDRYTSKAVKKIHGINKATLEMFKSYSWPGNIRELQNVIERSIIVCETEVFTVDRSWLYRKDEAGQSSRPQLKLAPSREKETIEAALAETGGRVSGPSGAAAKLGVPPSTLESKIKALKIDKYRFRKRP